MNPLQPKTASKSLSTVKKIAITGLIASWVIMPELLWHKLTFILHILYETGSFLLEEMLIHGLGMRKYYAQLTLFYAYWALALVSIYGLWRRLPGLMDNIKNHLLSLYRQFKYQAIEAWLTLSAAQKIKFLLFQFAITAGSFMLLLS